LKKMPGKDLRRDERIPCTLAVRLAWTTDGSDRYARGKCRDISTAGLRVETKETIPAQGYVNLRVEKMDVAGSARVRYIRRSTVGYVVGLELNQKVRKQLLDALRATLPDAAP
jgi:hypothetical protein